VFAKKRGFATWFLARHPLITPIPFHACILYIKKKIKKKKILNEEGGMGSSHCTM
jgi:hypothetical protein